MQDMNISEFDCDEEDIWGASVSDELKEHVIAQLNKYIAAKSIQPQSELDYDDAKYAQSCVWRFQQTGDLMELEDILIYQDTLPREECFEYILEGGDAVGLSLVDGRLSW